MSKCNAGKCNECKYEGLSEFEHPCNCCRWKFKIGTLAFFGRLNYFEPKEAIEHDGCVGCVYEHESELHCSLCKMNFKPSGPERDKHLDYYKPKENKADMVNHPQHYQHGIEPIEYIESHDLNFNLGNVIKYVSRAGFKDNELEDLKKAKWYLEREINKHGKYRIN